MRIGDMPNCEVTMTYDDGWWVAGVRVYVPHPDTGKLASLDLTPDQAEVAAGQIATALKFIKSNYKDGRKEG